MAIPDVYTFTAHTSKREALARLRLEALVRIPAWSRAARAARTTATSA